MTNISIPRRSNTNSSESVGNKVELGTRADESLDRGRNGHHMLGSPSLFVTWKAGSSAEH